MTKWLFIPMLFFFAIGVFESGASEFPHYEMDIYLTPEQQSIRVEGTLMLPSMTEPKESIGLALNEQIENFSVEILEPSELSAKSEAKKKATRPYSRPGWGTTTWDIPLTSTFPAGKQLKLKFSFQSKTAQSSLIYSLRKDVMFGAGIGTAWYPQFEEKDATTRLRGLRATGRLKFHVPSGFIVHASGKKISSESDEQNGVFQFENTSPLFFSFAAAKFIRVAPQGDPPVSGFLLRKRINIDAYLGQCSRILKVLTDEFGPTPLGHEFAIVELPTDQSNDAGFAGASLEGFMLVNSDFLDQPFNTAYYGHDVGHQWWGSLVRVNGTSGIWILQEGLAQYGSLRAVEIIEGPEKAKQYRTSGYPGYFEFEASGSGYLRFAAAGLDLPLSTLPADLAISRRLSNSKGMFVWDMLAREVGRDRFNQALRNIAKDYAYKRIRWEEFLQQIQNSADHDLSGFYKQWFDGTGAPSLELKWKRNEDKLEIQVTQPKPAFYLDVPIEISGSKQNLTETMEIQSELSSKVILTSFNADKVELDPDFNVLRWTPELRSDAVALIPYTRGYMKLMEGKSKEAENDFRSALDEVPKSDQHGLEFLLRYGLSQALSDQDRFADALPAVRSAIALKQKRTELLPWVYLHLAQVAKKLGNQDLLKQAVQDTQNADRLPSGRTGAAEQAEALLNDEP